jgi:hypothetical protein
MSYTVCVTKLFGNVIIVCPGVFFTRGQGSGFACAIPDARFTRFIRHYRTRVAF